MKNQFQTFTIFVMVYAALNFSCEKLDIVPVTKFSPNAPIINAYYNSAIVNGRFIDVAEGITSYGHCWSTSPNPKITDSKTIIQGVPPKQVDFISELKGLLPNTRYYVRTYTIRGDVADYGENYDFKTIETFFIIGSFNNWNIHGLYTEKRANGVFYAYQYLTSSDLFMFLPYRDSWENLWGAKGGDCGTGGTVVPRGGAVCVNKQAGYNSDGFYEIKFDAANQTLVLKQISFIGVVGTAQNGGWNSGVNLIYNPALKKWQGQVTFLSTGEYKFWADNAWEINFGGSLTNLINGGTNLLTPGAGTYCVVLDISGPDSYNAELMAPVTDVDGNIYTIIGIGTHFWMKENLKTTKYKNNTSIVYPGTDNTAWTNNTTGAYAWYGNDEATYKSTYGALYNWYAVNTGNLCPIGWHVPTDEEWTTLENYLIANGYNYDGTTNGNKIAKALAATSYWASSTTAGAPGNTDYPAYRNKSGFTALPGGNRGSNGLFFLINSGGNWWSSSAYDTQNAWSCHLNCAIIDLAIDHTSKTNGYSVRCIKD